MMNSISISAYNKAQSVHIETDAPCNDIHDVLDHLIIPALHGLGFSPELVEDIFDPPPEFQDAPVPSEEEDESCY